MSIQTEQIKKVLRNQKEIMDQMRIIKDRLEEKERIVNTREAAEMLKFSYHHFMTYISHKIPSKRIGKRMFYKLGDIYAYRDGKRFNNINTDKCTTTPQPSRGRN